MRRSADAISGGSERAGEKVSVTQWRGGAEVSMVHPVLIIARR